MNKCKWLPDVYEFPNWNNYKQYEDYIYKIFCNEVINGELKFFGKKVNIRKHPKYNEKEEAFYHCTCKNYDKKQRDPDPNRMIRISWISAIIKNPTCKFECCDCKPLLWRELYKNGNYRYSIYFQRFIVILEEREDYFLLITSFYVEEEYYHKGLLKKSQKAENAIDL